MYTLAFGPARAMEANVLLPRESTALENVPTCTSQEKKPSHKLYCITHTHTHTHTHTAHDHTPPPIMDSVIQ